MGSRIRSASSIPVGALTEADFNKVFEDTKPTPVKTVKEFLTTLEECNKALLSSTVDWNKKSNILSQLRGLLKAEVPNALNIFVENGGLWERCLVEGMKELRSTLSRDYCITVAYFAKYLGANFFKQTNLLLENLMNLSQNSARIMSSSAVMASEYIAKYVQNPKLVNAIAGFTTSKAVAIRRNVVTMCKQILVFWPSDLIESQNVIKILMEIVKSGCCDADLQCRQLAKDAYFSLAEKFPDQANTVYESLDPQKQKMINDVYRSAASSTHSIVHERPDILMGQRLQAQQSQFLSNRSHSDVHFRHNINKQTPLKPNIHVPKGRTKSPIRSTPVKPRATAPKLTTNGYPGSAFRNVRPSNGNPDVIPHNSGAAGVFGPIKSVARMQYNPPSMIGRPPSSSASRVVKMTSSKTPLGIKPNIRPPTVLHAVHTGGSTYSDTLNEHVPRKEIYPDVPDLSEITISGEKYVENTLSEIITELTEVVRKVTNNLDNYVPELTTTFFSIKKLIEQKEEMAINSRHWLPILLLLSKIFRQSHVPSEVRVEALDCAKSIIEMDPLCLGDKHEFLIMGILEAFDRKNLALYRAAEECAIAVVKPLNVNQAKDLLLPLIEPGTESDDIKPEAIAGAVKLLTASIKDAKLQVVNDLFMEISPQILNCFNHPEPIVRRAVVMYYVSVAKIIGLERVTSNLSTSVVKLVNVYYDKVNQHSLV